MKGIIIRGLSLLWKCWFYLWMICVILFLSPALLCVIWSEKQYKAFFSIARIWALFCFYGIGMRYQVDKNLSLQKNQSYIFVSNHTSMLDIMLMLILSKDNPFVFVGKSELAQIPVFGFFYKKTCILVDRSSVKSRHQVFEQAQRKLDSGLSICIFPEGGVNDDRTVILDRFKDGAFRLAIDYQIPIVVRSFHYLRYMFPFEIDVGYPGTVPVKTLEVISTEGKEHLDVKKLKIQVYELLYNDIISYERKYTHSLIF